MNAVILAGIAQDKGPQIVGEKVGVARIHKSLNSEHITEQLATIKHAYQADEQDYMYVDHWRRSAQARSHCSASILHKILGSDVVTRAI